MADIIIRNGRVVDGMGNPWSRADLSIAGDRIEHIGHVEGSAPTVIDAQDMCVCPGFIDIHAHPDLTILYKEVQDYKLRQGITSEVSGNCGFTAAPLNPETADMLKRYVGFITPPSGVSWEWRTFADYLDVVRSSVPATNIAPLIGHGTVRIAVLGFDQRAPTPQELERMKALTEEAMEAGAFGLSTGLVYVPGTYSETEEIVELAKVASRYGGFYATHMRNEDDRLMDSIRESIEIGLRADLPVQISHHKAAGKANHGRVGESLALLERTREDGLDITADQYPYHASSTTLLSVLPPWAQEGGVDQVMVRLQDARDRERIRGELLSPLGETRMGAGLDGTLVSSLSSEANQRFIGLSINEISDLRNQDPVDALFDLLLEERCNVGMVAFSMSEEDVRTVMAHPTTIIGTDGLYSPGNPHPRIYGTYPRILGRYVREEKLLTLEEAVRKMTSFPARKLGLANKGVLRAGADADVVIFDPKKVIDKATFQQARQYPEGIEYVIVNGRICVEGGRFNGQTAGRVLTRGGG
jgi:N-acyl-D-amino-acid deacylase